MYTQQLTELIDYLGQKRHSIDDVLAHLVLRTLTSLDCTSSFVADLKRDGKIEVSHSFGLDSNFFDYHPAIMKLTDQIPIAVAISKGELQCVSTLPNWGKKFAALAQAPLQMREKSFLGWPIEVNQTPVGGFGIFCNEKIEMSEELEIFLIAISRLFSLYFYQSTIESEDSKRFNRLRALEIPQAQSKTLTERQLHILKLIADGHTNITISDALGYSESTIRQESIRIYSKLGCNGRREASAIYRDLYLAKAVS